VVVSAEEQEHRGTEGETAKKAARRQEKDRFEESKFQKGGFFRGL
jgi:hypothetical protein